MQYLKRYFLLYIAFFLFSVSSANADSGDKPVDHSKHIDHSKHAAHLSNIDRSITTVTNISIPDVTLVTQEGKEVRVYSDLVRGRTVLLNTIFTTCTTICPPMGANFARLQRLLDGKISNDELKERLVLLSISVDPVTDTPQRLKAWKEKFKGQPGWTLLTGNTAEVNKVLKATGLFVADFEDHSPIALLGKADNNSWKRMSALHTPLERLAEMIIEQINPDNSTDNSGP